MFPVFQTISHSLLGLSVVAALLFGRYGPPMVVDPSTAYAEGVFASIPFVQEGYLRHYLTMSAFYLELVILAYAVWLLAFDPTLTSALDGREANGDVVC